MTSRVATVDLDCSLAEIRHIFASARFHHLPVMSNNRIVGIISDKDLLAAISPHLDTPREGRRDEATLNRKAHQIMSRNVLTVSPDMPVYAVIEHFLDNDLSCLPVEDGQGHLAGILSWKDVFRYLSQKVKSKQAG